ncbi:hypothetical protein SAMN05414139_02942 [Burkholderia sp. D7]|nr:hypothetical protein SAMN05414139_02942 [Burkholderia sp. D7]
MPKPHRYEQKALGTRLRYNSLSRITNAAARL